jgi:hypothetical protein
MLGVLLCDNNKFLLSYDNNHCYLSYWYMILKKRCSKIIIYTTEDNNQFIKYVINDDILIINDKKLIRNEDYDFAITINLNNFIEYFDFNIINNGAIIYLNNIQSIIIFKKEIEDFFINNEFIFHHHLFNIEYLFSNEIQINNRIYIKGLLIIISLSINDIDQFNFLKNLRIFYPNEFIVIVDNNSKNQDWVNIANDLGIYIIKNKSYLFNFEIGAYNLALKYFKADKYLCIQHNFNLHSKIKHELSNNKPDAFLFNTTTNLNCDINGLQLLNKYFKFLNMKLWDNEPSAIGNNFYCNDLIMQKILNNKLFDLVCNNKEISNIYEKIIGTFFFRNLGYI